MRKGVQSNNEVFRLIALLMIGRPVLVRQAAFRQGLRGSSRFWRVVAFWIITRDIWRKLTVVAPDRLGTERLVEGQGVTVLALTRPSRREQRRSARAS